MNGGPQRRVSSPSGLSTLTTSAPRSASVCPIQGPARMRASSTTRIPESAPMPLEERLQAGLRAPQYEGVDVVRAFVGVDRLQIGEVAHDAVFDLDAVAAMHVARRARDLQRLAAIVALHHRDHFRRRLAFVHQPPEAQSALKPEGDLGLHVGELLLKELGRGERPAELLAVETVLARAHPAVLGRAHRAPGNAVARAVEAPEGALEAGNVRQERILRNLDVVEHDLSGDRGAQTELAFDLRRAEALHA